MDDLSMIMASPVAATIMVITIITSMRAFNDPLLKRRLTFHPYTVWREKDWKQLFTSGLVHANGMHLLFNMLAFYFFAFALEGWLGHIEFALLYIVSLAVSDLPTMIRHKDDPQYFSLGASGAVSAVVLSVIMLNPTIGIGIIFLPGSIPGWLFAILFLGFSFYAGIKRLGNINHDAHLWGAIAGIVITLILEPDLVIGNFRILISQF